MESNSGEPIIIEFNGLPGCGKSTISKQLKKELEDLGHDVYLTYKRKYTPHNIYWILLNPKYWKIVFFTIRYSRLFIKRRPLIRLVQIAGFIRKYNHFISDNQKGIMIIDQGIIQSIISLAHEDKLIESTRLTRLIKVSGINTMPLHLINCHINPDVAESRMVNRPYNGARIGRLSKEERSKAIEIQKQNLSFIRNQIRTSFPNVSQIDINTECSVETNVNEITNQIKLLQGVLSVRPLLSARIACSMAAEQ